MAVIKWADQTAVTTVKWLWKPFIPFGKVTLVEGNGGDGGNAFAGSKASGA